MECTLSAASESTVGDGQGPRALVVWVRPGSTPPWALAHVARGLVPGVARGCQNMCWWVAAVGGTRGRRGGRFHRFGWAGAAAAPEVLELSHLFCLLRCGKRVLVCGPCAREAGLRAWLAVLLAKVRDVASRSALGGTTVRMVERRGLGVSGG